ncbi:uncharacterized protein isoform X2 [Takifugu rubripes]|uniref:uncharacterized protein isoform X2 n=1 Tax=Takifugu rubripes TaxID=31033 RepID=UPI00114569DA|nr:uncharacterized protein LOC105416826 isoform X2 [Takifugu rubripes]
MLGKGTVAGALRSHPTRQLSSDGAMMDPRLSAESKSIPPQLPADPPSHFIHFKTCRKTRGAGAQVTCGEKLTEQLALHIFTSGASSAHHLSWRGIGRPADLCPLGKGRQHRQHVQQHQFFSSVLKAPVHRRSRFPRLFIIPHSRGGGFSVRPVPARAEPQERRPSKSAAASNELAGAVSSLGPSSRRNGRASSKMGRALPCPPEPSRGNPRPARPGLGRRRSLFVRVRYSCSRNFLLKRNDS